MTEIKYCPFCGSYYDVDATVTNNHVYVTCNNCCASGPMVMFNALNFKTAKEKAIEQWNRRVFVWE